VDRASQAGEVDTEFRQDLAGGYVAPHQRKTILLDGRVLFSPAAGVTVLACRLYHGEAGYMGAPTVEQLIEALEG
jgi:hypothetical protein